MTKDYIVNLKDIAEATGYSISTVSRVIKKKGEIAQAMRDRILEVAGRLGYHDNRLSNGMRTGKTGTVGIVSGIHCTFFAELFSALNRELVKRDYLGLVSLNDDDEIDDQACIRRLLEHRVDGILIVPRHDQADNRYFTEATSRGLPIVSIDRKVPADIDFVGTDDYAGGWMAAEYLYKLGHRRLGYYQGPQGASPARLRREGFEDFCRKHADCTLILIGDGGWDTPEAAMLTAALQAHPELTAVGAFTDIFAAQLLEAARAVGRRVPEELSVVGFANMSDPAILSHGIASLEQHAGKLAEAAVTALFDRIAAPEAPWQEIRVVPELVVKKTTASPRRR